jgi:anaerobic ribonucleoside-triphosphate reductase activating protein
MDIGKTVKLAGIAYESLANGPGIRRVLFSQGCSHNCKDCFNPDTHSYNGGKDFNLEELVEGINSNPMIKGVTFSGGDPLEQADKFAYIAKCVKGKGLNIWSYTGYTFEYIIEHRHDKKGWDELLKNIDVLVDGKFKPELKEEGLRYRGSKNQRIIDVQKSLTVGEPVVINFD